MRTFLCLICLLSLTHAADLRGNSAQRRVESNATIVGGDDNLAIPYFARFSNSACGGALIGKDTVLTAAHCVVGGFPPGVFIGATNTTNGLFVEVDSSNSKIHPNFNGNVGVGSDVAVMKLKTKVGSISSARLNKDCFQPSFGDFYRVYGFGRTSDGGSISDVLKSLKQDYVPIGSTRAYILAEDSSSNGVCQGDSGGPFVNSQDVIFGVVSFTIGSCANGTPDGYARVSTYYNWIRKTVCRIGDADGRFDCSCVIGASGFARDVIINTLGLGHDGYTTALNLLGASPEIYSDSDFLTPEEARGL